MSGYNLYVTGSVPAHNEERVPKPEEDTPEDAPPPDAFDHELQEKPQAFFPAEDAEGADAEEQS